MRARGEIRQMRHLCKNQPFWLNFLQTLRRFWFRRFQNANYLAK